MYYLFSEDMLKVAAKAIVVGGIALGIALLLGACGNTISGVGKDISDVGAKVTAWQNSKEEVKNLLYENIAKPRASIRITDKSYKGLLVSDLNTNDSFVTTSSKEVFILKEKRRTRYSCISKSSNKEYSISPDAQVTKCN